MIIRMSNDLKEQKIYANGDELANIMGFDRGEDGKRILNYPLEKEVHVHTFDNPVLMTDNHRISQLNPTLRDTLFALYESKPRIVEYDGVSTIWDQRHSNVWGPSIDTLLFAKALRKIFVENCENLAIDIDISKIKRVIEIGCGSALLSKYLLAKSNLEELIINDINPDAVRCAIDNIRDSRIFLMDGDGLELLRYETDIKYFAKKFDLIVCNAPYVPRPDSIGGNPYEGIELLNHLIHNGQQYLNKDGVIITNISSLAWDIVFKEIPEMKMNMVDVMKVPLKVNNILNNTTWINYLKRSGLDSNYNNGYEYWQKINIVVFSN